MFPLHVLALLVGGAPAVAEPRALVALGCGAVSHHRGSREHGTVGISRLLEQRTVSHLRDGSAHLSWHFCNAGSGGSRGIYVGRWIGYLFGSCDRHYDVAAGEAQATTRAGDDWRRARFGKDWAGIQPFDLLRVPVLGTVLRARYGRQSLQTISLLAMCIVIAHGFAGHPMAAMNLAGVLPWNIVRALGVVALLFVGNLFCMACPFTLPRELARRFGWARLRWPQWLRVKWIGVGLMLAFFFGYERFALWDSPARTAWLLIAYVGTAFLVDTFFRGASFCKYVCPIGQFNFVGSLISPTTLKIRSAATCETCATRDCIRGNTQQRGCELELYLPEKRSNADCTLCMDCVKACPHDNIGILPRSMAQDVLTSEPTSSLGRLSRRTDVAAVALVLVVAGFANAAAMVGPGVSFLTAAGRHLPWLASGAGSFAGVVAGMLLAAGVVWVVSQAARGGDSRREAFCRGALALVPLGMGMWAAHLLFHLLMGVPGLLPLVQEAGRDFGLHWMSAPQWSAMTSVLQGNGLLQLQLLFLDGGLLLSLYLVWRMAASTRVVRRLPAVAPLALFAVALYAFGFWLLLQPMQMRGMMMGGM